MDPSPVEPHESGHAAHPSSQGLVSGRDIFEVLFVNMKCFGVEPWLVRVINPASLTSASSRLFEFS